MTAGRDKSIITKAVSLLLIVTLTMLGCNVPPEGTPMAGIYDYQRPGHVAFRFGHVNTLGGNLMVPRVDLSIDTLIGTMEIGATYNSATKSWTWSFDEHYDNVNFTDASGAVHQGIHVLAEGEGLPGTTWVKSSTLRIKSKAGLVRHFWGTGERNLRWMYWGDAPGWAVYPRLNFKQLYIAGQMRIVAVKQCGSTWDCSDVFSVSYDAAGRVVAIDDRAGRRAEFQWDGSELVNARDGLDVAESRPGFSYEYSLSGLLTAITNGEGERTEIAYSSGQVVEIQDIGEGDPTHTFFYEGKVAGFYTTRYWDPLGNEHRYTYDGLHQLYDIENVASAEHTSWVSYIALRPTSMTDTTGVTTLYTWLLDDLVTEVQPSGNVIQYSYEPTGINRPTEVTRNIPDRANPGHRPFLRIDDSVGLVEQRTYSASSGQLLSVSNGTSDTVIFEYHPGVSYRGQISGVTFPSGADLDLAGYGFDAHPTYSFVPQSGIPNQRRVFDLVGNRLLGAELGMPERGGIEGRSYDADRNVRTISLEGGENITIDVRSDGQLTGIQRPGGDDHAMIYDALGRLVSRSEKVDGLWHETTFEFDIKGRRTAVELPNGMRQEIQYDASDRITSILNRRDGVTESYASMTYASGRLASRFDSVRNGTDWYYYDAAGRISSITHHDGTSTARQYDLRSRKTSEDYLDANLQLLRSLGYAYDDADREVGVLDGAFQMIQRTFTDGRLSEISYGNGLTRTFSYDGGRLTGSQTLDASQAVVESTTIDTYFELFPVGLIRIDVSTTTTGGVSATTFESYELTPLHGGSAFQHNARVTAWQDGAADVSLVYDGKSNILAEGTTTFSYNTEGNRLLSATPSVGSPIAYTYDTAGYTTSRDGKSITWTANGRIAAHGADLFEWDALGAPISFTVEGETVKWLFGGAVKGDALGTPARIDGVEYSIALQANSHLYRHLDFRGNVKFTSGDTAVVEAHYAYSAYGLEEVFGSTDDNVRFAGKSEIGDLMILGARSYDPLSRRFLSPDPIFSDINQYAYTLGNPVWWWDPDGASPAVAAVALTVVLVAAVLGLGVALQTGDGLSITAAGLGVFGVLLGFFGLGTSTDVPFYESRRPDWENPRDRWKKGLPHQADSWLLVGRPIIPRRVT